jgi:hypothetical protein
MQRNALHYITFDLPGQAQCITLSFMAKDTQLSIRLPAELRAELQSLADADHRTLSSYIELALAAHVERAKASAAKNKRSR